MSSETINDLHQLAYQKSTYSGFWKRFFAFVIDYNIALLISLLIVICGSIMNSTGFKIDSPFGVWESERIKSTDTKEETLSDGTVAKVEMKIVEQTQFSNWKYLIKKETTTVGDKSDTKTILVDENNDELSTITKDDLAIYVFLIYLTLFEASSLQASLGKLVMGIKVVDINGNKLDLPRSFMRNILKLISALMLFIGFAMAGWTKKKQAIHDKISKCLVINKEYSIGTQPTETKICWTPMIWLFASMFVIIPCLGILLAIILPKLQGH